MTTMQKTKAVAGSLGVNLLPVNQTWVAAEDHVYEVAGQIDLMLLNHCDFEFGSDWLGKDAKPEFAGNLFVVNVAPNMYSFAGCICTRDGFTAMTSVNSQGDSIHAVPELPFVFCMPTAPWNASAAALGSAFRINIHASSDADPATLTIMCASNTQADRFGKLVFTLVHSPGITDGQSLASACLDSICLL